jgi:hypothetical protein
MNDSVTRWTSSKTSTDQSAPSRTLHLKWGACAAVAAWIVVSGSAFAQTRDPAAARTLFNEARTLMSQKKFDQACPKFEESMRLDNGIGTRFNLADCWEHTGRTASAWSLFLDVAASAKSSGQAEREKVARERATALEPRLSRLTIQVQAKDADIEVRKNDVIVGRALFGTATPVDPASYVIEARAPKKKSWKTTIAIAPGALSTTITVPELEKEAPPIESASAASGSANGTGAASTRSHSTEVAADTEGSSNGRRTMGWVLGGAGVVGLGVGVVFAALTKSADDRAATLCTGGPDGNQCRDDAEKSEFESESSKAKSRATVAYAGFIGGGAALVGGAVLLLTSGSNDRAAAHNDPKPRVVPLFGDGPLGLA